MATAHSFAPIVDEFAHTLILGSMPGAASLEAQRYYAHPRNAFWPIMGELFDAGPSFSYEVRAGKLLGHGIAVWDVLKLCTRDGSLDSAIVESSIVVNDFGAFFGDHPCIERVFFNGAKAEATFGRHVIPMNIDVPSALVRLPSTSPAHASMNFEQKLRAWSVIATDRVSD